jgi:hypothetical protein
VTVRLNHPRLLGAGLLVVVAAAALTALLSRPTHTPHPAPNTHRAPNTHPLQSRAFPALTPAAAPGTWRQLTLPNGTAVLSYPPSLRPVSGDKDAVDVARLSPAGTYLLYLNATPRQGTENSQNWAAARLGHLHADETASARQDAAASQVAFLGGTGSCVLDDYVTEIGAHHYQEIACLVQGRSGASVIVAAAPAAQWTQAAPVLEQAVAAYRVR